MRRLAASILLCLLVPLPAAAADDPEEAMHPHLSVKAEELGPGELLEFPIFPGDMEGPWREGMVFILYLQFGNATPNLRVELIYNNTTVVQSWMFLLNSVNYKSTRIPYDDGPYALRYLNLDPQNRTQFYTYFDQTCACASKPIPMNTGWVIMHYDLPAGKETEIGVPLAAGWEGRAVLAKLKRPSAQWPADFQIVDDAQAAGPEWLRVSASPAQAERYYLIVFADKGASFPPTPDKPPFEVTVLVESKTKEAKEPSLGPAVLGAVVVALVALLRRR